MSTRNKLAGKTTKLARPREKVPDHPGINDYAEGSFYKVPIEEIKPNPDQPRQYFDEESLNELSQSIRDKGVLQPVIIRRDDAGNIYLVAGERRLRAARQAGLAEIPAVLTKGHPAEIALIENLQRENLKPVEEAEALERMMEKYDYTQKQLAQVIGKSRVTVTETLSLNKLPPEIKDECRRVDIFSKRLLIEIARQKNPKAMASLFEKAKKAGLKSDQVKDIVRAERRSPIAIATRRLLDTRTYLEKADLETEDKAEKAEFIDAAITLQSRLNEILD